MAACSGLLIVAVLVLPIVLFLLVAVSPALFGQGTQWFTPRRLSPRPLSGPSCRASLDSLGGRRERRCSGYGARLGRRWVVQRTTFPGRRVWSAAMFALLLAPSYLVALGWERLLEPSGVLDARRSRSRESSARSSTVPSGVILVLTMKGLPFAYLAISAALRGLGEEFEAAARVHGGGGSRRPRIVVALLAPAVLVGLRHRVRRVRQRLRRGGDARQRRALPGRDVHAVQRGRQLPRATSRWQPPWAGC